MSLRADERDRDREQTSTVACWVRFGWELRQAIPDPRQGSIESDSSQLSSVCTDNPRWRQRLPGTRTRNPGRQERPATGFETKSRLARPRATGGNPSTTRNHVVRSRHAMRGYRWARPRLHETGPGLFLLGSHVGAFAANHPRPGHWQCNREGTCQGHTALANLNFAARKRQRVDEAHLS